jgi:nucleoid-associated protein YgaU
VIATNSRYASSKTQKIQVAPGDVRVTIVFSAQSDWKFNFTYYQVKQGDRIDLLARLFYGDDTRWWVIADANPDILDWTTLPTGLVLRIPSV